MRLAALVTVCFALFGCGGGGGSSPPPPPPPPPPPANQVPVAADLTNLIRPAETATGTFSATDADGDPLTYALVDMPANGMVTLSGTGDQDYAYVPDAGFVGSDTFTYAASDAEDTSNTATVTVTVELAWAPWLSAMV